MVGAGHPQGGVALHPLGADQNVLHGVVHRVAHVQLTGDVGRRHHDGVRFLVRVGLGVEVAALLPELVDPVLHLAGIVLLCEFLHGQILLNVSVGDKKAAPRKFHGTAEISSRGTTQIAHINHEARLLTPR